MKLNPAAAQLFSTWLALAGLAVSLGARPVRAAEADAIKTGAASPTNTAAEVKLDAVANSVVKVFSTLRYPDLYKPWIKDSPSDVTGTGVVIEGKRILTCAHMVTYASQVQIQANQAGDKLSAKVEAVAPGIDLAVLKLEDETFFDTHPPLVRAKALPEIREMVMAYGYPEGGTSLSITKGIVSRIEFESYKYPVSGLRIQIDAAINPGNSGGPAVTGDKMIGLTFSHLGSADNIGYIIPNEEIELFLQDIADGHYDGKPAMYDDLQTLENPALRAFLKLDKSVEGMVVHKPYSAEPGYPLKEWDVITRIGDTPVDDQGMIKLGPNLRVRFQYLVQQVAKNGKTPLTIVRAGKELPVELPVSPKYPMVIPDLNGAYPSYFVYGPLVFSTATESFVNGFIRGNRVPRWTSWLVTMGSPLVKRLGDKPAFPGEELVVIPSPFFPHKLAKGYSDPFGQVVKTVNGIAIKNLGHLVEVLRDAKGPFIVVAFDSRYNETVVFPRADMLAATDEILTDNGVRSQGSSDTLAIWNAKPAP
ncbi:MAG TPA: trypsin-like peptidase domain-containing protein [Candidatus Acidoferrum sp.]|nr:trypsin-like peptidase domain-containing protein [Candidatus Acidoferrum sp.]